MRIQVAIGLAGASVLAALGCGSGSSGGAGGGSGGGSTTGTTTGTGTTGSGACQDLHDLFAAKAASVPCSNDDSTAKLASCQQVISLFPACEAQMQAVADCFAAEPDTSWTCDSTGAPGTNPGTCQTQVDALSACAKS